MASNVYHFEDHWRVSVPIESVWEVLARPEQYPLWWKGVYLSAGRLNSEDRPRWSFPSRGHRQRMAAVGITIGR
jgi:uncharacterized protein YndB with AHSA1/START domain